jgi:DNA polymerase
MKPLRRQDAAAAQRKPFLMPIRKSGHWKMLYLDFETRSHCDLKKHGVYNYAQDASTEVLCMSYAFGDEPVQTWVPFYTDADGRVQKTPFPVQVANHTGLIYAHNAAFERLIFWYVLQQNFALEQFYCTAAQARSNCAPGSLEDVGRFASASMKKDHRGSQLIRLLSIPQANGEFREDAGLMAEMVAYCEQDVKAMRAVSQAMRPLSADELLDYHVNERINDRGVLVDASLCAAAVEYAADETIEIQQIVHEVTERAITSVRSPKMREWVLERVGPEAKKLMWTGEKYSIDKTVRANLLAMENHDEIPAHVADVIQCADDLWASSVAKFSRLADLADVEDHRVRGAFVFAGGAATGRASSYGAQVHNFTRKCAKDPDEVRNAMVRGHTITPRFGKRITDVLKGMLRPALIAKPGHVLIAYDWSAIEGRVHPWLSNCPSGEAKLDVFRSGLDPYKVNATATFRTPYAEVTADQRQVGKVQELALGFLGGAGAFEVFGRAYGIHLSAGEVARAVAGWRIANPWAMLHGNALEGAFLRAMRNKGHEVSAGRVTYMFDGQMLWYSLPSGRVLCYPNAKFDEEGNVTYSKAAWKPAADAKEWPRARLWRGLACENVTQAAAHDILRHSLRQIDGVVLHVHDEIVVECPATEADAVGAAMHRVMCEPPAWATGLPLAAEGVTTTRYS